MSDPQEKPKETTWIDAWIRWDRDSKNVVDDEEDEEEEVPPTETFSFTYNLPRDAQFDRDAITLTFQGFPMQSEQIWNSTGLTLWPCSRYLCDYLVDNVDALLNNNMEQTQILELGSGLGRCGLLIHALAQALSKLGNRCHVWLTDGDTDTLKQLRANVELNASNNNQTTISCRQLLWGTKHGKEFLEQYFPSRPQQPPMHLIIGSDLIYVPKVIPPLFQTVQTLLSSQGTFLMAHSNRREGSSVTLEMVLEGAKEAGFRHEIVKEVGEEGIYILQFRREGE